jgi:heat shock protein HslJ
MRLPLCRIRGLDQLNTQLRLGLAAAIALSLAPAVSSGAFAQGRPPTSAQPEKNFPFDASWTLLQAGGKQASGYRITLKVDSNLRGTGFSGCNNFSAAAYPLRQQGFAVGPIAVTKKACDSGAMGFERSFLLALRSAKQWDLVQGRLVLKTGQGDLTFERGI